jgi:hypothetical protein
MDTRKVYQKLKQSNERMIISRDHDNATAKVTISIDLPDMIRYERLRGNERTS